MAVIGVGSGAGAAAGMGAQAMYSAPTAGASSGFGGWAGIISAIGGAYSAYSASRQGSMQKQKYEQQAALAEMQAEQAGLAADIARQTGMYQSQIALANASLLMAEAEAYRRIGNYNAAQGREAAEQAREAAAFETMMVDEAGQELMGVQRARYGSSGVKLTGSATEVMLDTIQDITWEKWAHWREGEIKAYNFLTQAVVDEYQGNLLAKSEHQAAIETRMADQYLYMGEMEGLKLESQAWGFGYEAKSLEWQGSVAQTTGNMEAFSRIMSTTAKLFEIKAKAPAKTEPSTLKTVRARKFPTSQQPPAIGRFASPGVGLGG